jgi:hypothetical protein
MNAPDSQSSEVSLRRFPQALRGVRLAIAALLMILPSFSMLMARYAPHLLA